MRANSKILTESISITDGVVDHILGVPLFIHDRFLSVHMVWTDGVVDHIIIFLVVLSVHMVWTDCVVYHIIILVGFVVRDNDNIILGFGWSW